MSPNHFQISLRNLKDNLGQLRKNELVPGIMYGQSLKQSLPIQIPLKHLQKIIANTAQTTLFNLMLDNTSYECVLRHYLPDPLHSQILHVDFQYVRPGEVLKMQVPVIYEGLDLLRSQKLILEKAIDKLPLVGTIDVLPQAFTVDLSDAKKGHKIFARDIVLPENTELLLHPETIIATVQ